MTVKVVGSINVDELKARQERSKALASIRKLHTIIKVAMKNTKSTTMKRAFIKTLRNNK